MVKRMLLSNRLCYLREVFDVFLASTKVIMLALGLLMCG